jgi:hypothetical protein
MSEIEDSALEGRLRRNLYIVVAISLVFGAVYGGWRMAAGVLLGAALSIFNHRWLTGSIRAILQIAAETQSGRVPPFTAGKFIFRYYIIALVIGLAVWSGEFSPLGIGIGFAAFVGGVMIEAGYQLYLFLRSYKNFSS